MTNCRLLFLWFFFFKQKTAYEMRISDWSSDVCSSDLMSVFDVHINRAPVGGRVSRVVYVPGKFLNADLDKASDDNERQYFVVERPDGVKVGFTQIAGLVARRIVKFAKVGDIVVAGQRIGLIRFGSRVDVFLPSGTAPTVVLGQRAIAGETVRSEARRGGKEGVSTFRLWWSPCI